MSRTRLPASSDRAPSFAYKAFISYSHAADGELAAALQRALQRFAKPWHQRRAVRVFRDTTGLGVTPDLWDSIRDALEASEYFILFASERAARSRWVEQELDAWLNTASADRLLIVWTDGELLWNADGGDFDWQRTTALHPRVRGVFDAEPLHLDLRWARTADDLSPRRPEFIEAVARLSATLRGLPFDDLIGEDVRQHRRARRLAGSAVAALVVLFASAVVAAVLAVQQRNAARQRLVDLIVANGAREIDTGDLSASALWFAEALRLEPAAAELDLHRVRLRTSVLMHPALLQVWSADAEVVGRSVAVGRDGRFVVSDGPRIWNASSGEPLPLQPMPGEQRVLDIDAAGDRPRIVTAIDDVAIIADAQSGEELTRLAHPDDVRAAVFSDDGRLLVTSCADGAVRVWDAADAQLLHVLQHESALIYAQPGRDNRYVTSSTRDSTVHIWTLPVNGGAGSHISIPHREPVELIDVAAGGRFAITVAGRDARLWRLGSDREPEHLDSWIGVDHAEFSPDGSRLLMADAFGEASVFRLDPVSEIVVVRHDGPILHAAFDPDGGSFATAGTDRMARIWHVTSGAPLSPPLQHEATVTHVAFSPDGVRLATATADGLVRLWDRQDAVPAHEHEYVHSAEFDPSGTRLMTLATFDVKLWTLDGRPPLTLKPGSQVYSASWSPDGQRVATASQDGAARIWHAGTGAEMLSLQHERRVSAARFHPNGHLLVTAGAAGQSESEVSVWDLETGQKRFSLPHEMVRADQAWFNAEGTRLLTTGAGGALLWNLATRETLPTDSLENTRNAMFSPDGSLFVSHEAGGARVYDAGRGSSAGPIIRNDNYMTERVLFGADSRSVLVVGGGYARLWDASDGTPRTPPLRHGARSSVRNVAMSPDSRLLATVADDGSVRLWDARVGRAVSPPLRHARANFAVFSPDASRIATVGNDHVRVWDLAATPPGVGEESLAVYAGVLAARRIDATDALVPLDAAQLLDGWIRLSALRKRAAGLAVP